jgi:phosphatidylinositol alpha-1,6-mannosyltransferase
MRHLLVTNDFPPKVGGIQSYLWELWRRLPAHEVTVLALDHPEAGAFDAEQSFRIERVAAKVLLPTPGLARRINALAAQVNARAVLLDPAFPLGSIGSQLDRPYGLVVHGAEVTVPRSLPFVQLAQRQALRGAGLVVAAGDFPAAEAYLAAGRRLSSTVVVPPGVDVDRFVPLSATERARARDHLGIGPRSLVVASVSRLVPRKGMDVLIHAAAQLRDTFEDLLVVIAGDGRDRPRLEQLIAHLDAPVRLLGRVDDADLPALYGAADVFTMCCRSRWAGLEQEGFGIVFLEAAAAGVPQIAGRSGGSTDAVVDGVTGLVLDPPTDVELLVEHLTSLLGDPVRRAAMASAGRARAVASFTYDSLAFTLATALDEWGARLDAGVAAS